MLATTLRAGANCTLGTVEQLTYDEYVRSLPNPSYLIVLSLNPLPGAAILQFPLPIVFAAIDRLLGGTGDSVSPKRPLTEIESNLMRSVVDRTLRELEYAYETLVRVEAEIVQQEFNPQFAQIAAPSDMAMVVSFDTRIGEKHGNATICVPFSTMQPVLESLASQSLLQDHRGQDPVLWQQQLERALSRVMVETSVRFDAVELSSTEIVGLQVGDIVPLDHPIEQPVTISVDDVTCNKAVTGRRGKRLACLVVDAAEEHRPMTLIDDIEATNDVALAVTSALEQVLGEDVILAVGVAQQQAPDGDLAARGRDAHGVARHHRRRRRRDRADRGRAARRRARGPRRRRAAHDERGPGARSRRDRDERPGRRARCTSGARPKSRPRPSRPPTAPTSSCTRCSRTTSGSRAS